MTKPEFNARTRFILPKSIKGRMILLLCAVLAPLLLFEAYNFGSMFRERREEEIRANLEMARAMGKAFDAFLQGVLHQELAIGLALNSSPDPGFRNHILEENAKNLPGIRHFSWADPQGKVVASSRTSSIGVSIASREYFKEILSGREWAVSDLLLAQTEKDLPIFVIARAVRSQKGSLAGIVFATVEPNRLDDALAIERPREGGISLVDRRGMMVYRYPRVNLSWDQRNWGKFMPSLKKSLAGEEVTFIGIPQYEKNKRIMSSVPVKSIGWSAGAGRREEEVVKPILTALFRQGIVFSAVSLMGVILGWVIARNVSSHLKNLRAHALQLSSGELSEKITPEGPLELRDLAHAFNDMAEQVQQWMARAEARAADAERKGRALGEANDRLISVLDSITDGYMAFDREWRFLTVNRIASEDILKRSPEELLGQVAFDLFPQIAESRPIQLFRNAIAEGKPVHFEDRSPITEEWFEVHAYPRPGRLDVYLKNINERKEAEAALRESEERYRNLFETMKEAISLVEVITDQAGSPMDLRYLSVNPSFQRNYNRSREEIVGHTYRELMPNPNPEWIAMVGKVALSGKPLSVERYSRAIQRWIQVRAYSPRHGQSAILTTDIDDRKRAEDALRESEERLRLAQESGGVGVWDRVGKTGEVNFSDQMHRIYGLPPGTIKSYENWRRRVHPEDLVRVEAEREAAMARREPFDLLFRVLHNSGEIRWIVSRGRAVYNEAGEIERVIGVTFDVTDRKRMEEELRRSRDELELRIQERTAELKRQAELINLASNAIIVRELDGTITFWNDGATEMYGWTREEAMGKIARDLFHTQFPLPRDEIMTRFLKEGTWQGELIHTRKDGRKVDVLSRWTLQKDHDGRPKDVIHISYDITHRVKLEEQLRQAQRMEALGTLAGGIAHDFNNLLMPILLNTELALLDVESNVLPSAESLRVVQEGANRGKELVKQIIVFSRHKGQARSPIEISPVIKEGLKLLKSTALKAIEIRTQMEAGNIVLAEPAQIHQVLTNLCLNAAHSMRQKDGVLEVTLTKVGTYQDEGAAQLMGLKPGPYVQLTVKDNGHGMSCEVREKAFDPFFTTKQKGEGSGMGLAVVHGIVKKHEGAIRLESEEGKGTTVSVFLPVFDGGEREKIPSVPAEILKGKERILFVDDEESQVSTVRPLLERLGYRVTVEMDPRRALDLFRSQPDAFDLVITDQIMPHLPGKQLAQELLGIRPGIPIILCTGFSETVDEDKAIGIGIREFILKPFTVKEISELIRRALSKK